MKFEGFNRVVINADGEAVPVNRAVEMGIYPEIGYRRADGWSLGAPKELQNTAYSQWAGEWTHKIERGEAEWKPL